MPRFRYDRLMAFGWKVLLPRRDAEPDRDGGRRRGERMSVNAYESLATISALVAGLCDDVLVLLFKKKPTIAVSVGEEAACAAFSRPARAAPLCRRQGTLHRLRAVPIACPANAITVIGAENTPDDRRSPGERYAARYEIDELRCIFCGLCEEACPTDAIVLTPRFEMADYRRGSFIYAKDRLLVPPEAGVGVAPDERPGGIPADLGLVAEEEEHGRYHDGLRRDVARRDSQDAAQGARRVIAFWILGDCCSFASAVFTVTARSRCTASSACSPTSSRSPSLYLTLSAEFLAVIQVVVYSGAILMLFVFVIALLSSGVTPFASGPIALPRVARSGRRSWSSFGLAAAGRDRRVGPPRSSRRTDVDARPGDRRRLRQRRRLRHGAVHDVSCCPSK